MVKKLIIDWDTYNEAIDKLAVQISDSGFKPSFIICIARGGLIPAVLISHELGLKYTDLIYPNTLVVDDICDFEALQKHVSLISNFA